MTTDDMLQLRRLQRFDLLALQLELPLDLGSLHRDLPNIKLLRLAMKSRGMKNPPPGDM
jgi:hypothetical protein